MSRIDPFPVQCVSVAITAALPDEIVARVVLPAWRYIQAVFLDRADCHGERLPRGKIATGRDCHGYRVRPATRRRKTPFFAGSVDSCWCNICV